MASRRWLDANNMAKMGGGLLLLAIPVAMWLFSDRMSMRAWILGGLGLALFFWGLLSIGDQKSDWE